MKTQSIFCAVFAFVFIASFKFASAFGGGSIMGQVTDPETKEPVELAIVTFDCKGNIYQFQTNEKGFYYASNMAPGTYTIHISYMSKNTTIENVKVENDVTQEVNAQLGTVQDLLGKDGGVVIDGGKSKNPLLDKWNIERKGITPEEARQQGFTTISKIAEAAIPGIVPVSENYYVHGAREGGLVYYIDGCKVMGSPNIPMCGLDMYNAYVNFIPAKYGDTNGGVVVVDTRSYFSE